MRKKRVLLWILMFLLRLVMSLGYAVSALVDLARTFAFNVERRTVTSQFMESRGQMMHKWFDILLWLDGAGVRGAEMLVQRLSIAFKISECSNITYHSEVCLIVTEFKCGWTIILYFEKTACRGLPRHCYAVAMVVKMVNVVIFVLKNVTIWLIMTVFECILSRFLH